MSMYNDIDWGKDGNDQACTPNSVEVAAYTQRSPQGHWSFLGPGTEETWYETHTFEPEGLWNHSASSALPCKSGKQHKSCSSALCTMDDASSFLVIRLGPKTSECEKNVTVVSTVTGCDVTKCATTLHGFNKHASSRREAVSDSRCVPRCTEKNSQNLRLLTCVDHSTRPLLHTFCLQLVFVTRFHRASCRGDSSH